MRIPTIHLIERIAWHLSHAIIRYPKAIIGSTLLFAAFTVAEGARIAPGGSSWLVLVVATCISGSLTSAKLDSAAAGFLPGYGGALVGYPLYSLAQYGANPDLGLAGWFIVPVLSFVVTIVLGFLPGSLGAGCGLLAYSVRSTLPSR